MNNLLLIFLFIFSFAVRVYSQDTTQPQMQVHYINVGQAASALLEFPCGAMLIDAGAQDAQTAAHLISYLHDFFQRRPDLNNTLDLVIVTHCHIDHNLALDQVINNFKVKDYIDNGHRDGSGKKNQDWLEDNCSQLGITYESFTNEDIISKGQSHGYTDAVIDPINCPGANPQIMLLSSAFATKPDGWKAADYKNENNQSVVTKVVFGQASLLFLGDLQNAGIGTILAEYQGVQGNSGNSIFHSDILEVAHHGAENGTEADLLQAVSPTWAVISCGEWNFGIDGGTYTTYAYGHPRISTLDLLAQAITGNRDSSITVKAAVGRKDFQDYTVSKKIYATPWDNDITFVVSLNGNVKLQSNLH